MYQELCVFGFFSTKKDVTCYWHTTSWLHTSLLKCPTRSLWSGSLIKMYLIGFYHSTIASLLSQQLHVFFVQCSYQPETAKTKLLSFQLAPQNLFIYFWQFLLRRPFKGDTYSRTNYSRTNYLMPFQKLFKKFDKPKKRFFLNDKRNKF